jgi:hypothetical protein
MELSRTAEVITAAATLAGVVAIYLQVRQARKHAQTAFEDQLSREFREIAHQVPTKALLGEELTESEHAQHADELYRYLDLSNEQVFLRSIGRISASTWRYWSDGISDMLKLPAFRQAWENVQLKQPKRFSELQRFVNSGFREDPRSWR